MSLVGHPCCLVSVVRMENSGSMRANFSLSIASLCLSLDVDLEALGARLGDFEWSVVRTLEWCLVGVATNENELSLLQVARD